MYFNPETSEDGGLETANLAAWAVVHFKEAAWTPRQQTTYATRLQRPLDEKIASLEVASEVVAQSRKNQKSCFFVVWREFWKYIDYSFASKGADIDGILTYT